MSQSVPGTQHVSLGYCLTPAARHSSESFIRQRTHVNSLALSRLLASYSLKEKKGAFECTTPEGTAARTPRLPRRTLPACEIYWDSIRARVRIARETNLRWTDRRTWGRGCGTHGRLRHRRWPAQLLHLDETSTDDSTCFPQRVVYGIETVRRDPFQQRVVYGIETVRRYTSAVRLPSRVAKRRAAAECIQ
jgi:hypothetical protein